ncbi:MAG: hypothetical protein Udaeo2_08470 [Candidatus Udaeobacter sp.]|nr:MAG: hypothetical protein Udaeo2_08470 [Candidatus Udaeobacter sp.]
MTFDVQHNFRLAFGCGEKLIRLKTFDRRERIKRIRLCHRDHVVWNGIDAELPLKEILHNKLIAELGEIGDAINIVCKVGRICQANPVSSGRNVFSRNVGFIQVRILVLEIIRFEPRLAVVEVIYDRIKAHGDTAPAPIIEPEPPPDVVCDWEGYLSEERRPP